MNYEEKDENTEKRVDVGDAFFKELGGFRARLVVTAVAYARSSDHTIVKLHKLDGGSWYTVDDLKAFSREVFLNEREWRAGVR